VVGGANLAGQPRLPPEGCVFRGVLFALQRSAGQAGCLGSGRGGSDPSFAKLCGVCPLEASSGKTIRHRLNRGANRDANRALHVILVVRMRRHEPTRDYIARRLAEGKSKNEIMRCVKRYIAREIFHALQASSRRTTQLIA
jgi:transposase